MRAINYLGSGHRQGALETLLLSVNMSIVKAIKSMTVSTLNIGVNYSKWLYTPRRVRVRHVIKKGTLYSAHWRDIHFGRTAT